MEKWGITCYVLIDLWSIITYVGIFFVRWIAFFGVTTGVTFLVRGTLDPILFFLPRIVVFSSALALLMTLVRFVTRQVNAALLLALLLPLYLLTWAIPAYLPVAPAPQRSGTVSLPSPAILHGRNHSFFIDDQDTTAFQRIVVARKQPTAPGEPPNRLQFYQTGSLQGDQGEQLVLDENRRLATSEILGVAAPELPRPIIRLVRDLDAFVHYARELRGTTTEMFIAAIALFSFSAALLFSWSLARMSRWYLINVLVALSYSRFLLAVPRLIEMEVVTNLLFYLPVGRDFVPMLPAVVWGFCALTLLVTAIVQEPLPAWQRELGMGDKA